MTPREYAGRQGRCAQGSDVRERPPHPVREAVSRARGVGEDPGAPRAPPSRSLGRGAEMLAERWTVLIGRVPCRAAQEGQRFDKVAQEYSEDKAKGSSRLAVAHLVAACSPRLGLGADPDVFPHSRWEPRVDGPGVDGGASFVRLDPRTSLLTHLITGDRREPSRTRRSRCSRPRSTSPSCPRS